MGRLWWRDDACGDGGRMRRGAAAASGAANTLPPLGAFMTDLLFDLGTKASLGATATGGGEVSMTIK